jgi:hypothetical protein
LTHITSHFHCGLWLKAEALAFLVTDFTAKDLGSWALGERVPNSDAARAFVFGYSVGDEVKELLLGDLEADGHDRMY